MKTWSYLAKGGKIEMMKAFLYHVLNNLIVDQYRKRKTASLDVLLEKGYEPSTDEHQRLIDTLDGEKAMGFIENLDEKYREILRLRYVKHLSISEISLLTKQTKNTTSVQIHRALEKLKVLYEHSKGEEQTA